MRILISDNTNNLHLLYDEQSKRYVISKTPTEEPEERLYETTEKERARIEMFLRQFDVTDVSLQQRMFNSLKHKERFYLILAAEKGIYVGASPQVVNAMYEQWMEINPPDGYIPSNVIDEMESRCYPPAEGQLRHKDPSRRKKTISVSRQ